MRLGGRSKAKVSAETGGAHAAGASAWLRASCARELGNAHPRSRVLPPQRECAISTFDGTNAKGSASSVPLGNVSFRIFFFPRNERRRRAFIKKVRGKSQHFAVREIRRVAWKIGLSPQFWRARTEEHLNNRIVHLRCSENTSASVNVVD